LNKINEIELRIINSITNYKMSELLNENKMKDV